MVRRIPLPALLLLAGCAAAPPARLVIGLDPALRVDVDQFLSAHPLGTAEDLKAVPVGAIQTTSYAIVQVRTRERGHVHASHDLTVHVLRGRGRIVLLAAPSALEFSGEVRPLGPGDVVAIPRGTIHWFVNEGKEPAVAVACFTPPYDGQDIVTTPVMASVDQAVTAAALPAGPAALSGTRTDPTTAFTVTVGAAGRP